MNTPIMFMAWNKKEKKMYTHYEIDDMDKDGFVFWSDVLKGTNDWVPMQLTSLRSINDEPIYNHMIVKDKCGKYYCIEIDYYPLMALLSELDLEVVGNILQNPELLKLCS